jgi:hypothetical protein
VSGTNEANIAQKRTLRERYTACSSDWEHVLQTYRDVIFFFVVENMRALIKTLFYLVVIICYLLVLVIIQSLLMHGCQKLLVG